LDSGWFEPKTQSPQDIEAAERAMQFKVFYWNRNSLKFNSFYMFDKKLGWFAHPIFSIDGDYPTVMKEYVARHSSEEGYLQSRLPEFGQVWVEYIKGKN